MEAVERAVRLAPDMAPAHDYLGRALTAEGRRADAGAHLRRAAELRGQPWPPADGAALPATGGAAVAPAAPRP